MRRSGTMAAAFTRSKAKKGDTMQLKVTVKDASGNPIPEAPFVLTRGDGCDRKGREVHRQ